MYEGMMAESVRIAGHGGDEIAAYFAGPLGPGPYPGVVVIHHMPGWDDATKEITRRFARNQRRRLAEICGAEVEPSSSVIATLD